MSLQNALEFSSAALANPSMKSEVVSLVAGKSSQDAAAAIVAFGKAKGYDFTAEEILAAQQKLIESSALSEEDLAAIAGGGASENYAGDMVGTAASRTPYVGNFIGDAASQFTTDVLNGKPAGEAAGNAAVTAGQSYNSAGETARSSW